MALRKEGERDRRILKRREDIYSMLNARVISTPGEWEIIFNGGRRCFFVFKGRVIAERKKSSNVWSGVGR